MKRGCFLCRTGYIWGQSFISPDLGRLILICTRSRENMNVCLQLPSPNPALHPEATHMHVQTPQLPHPNFVHRVPSASHPPGLWGHTGSGISPQKDKPWGKNPYSSGDRLWGPGILRPQVHGLEGRGFR